MAWTARTRVSPHLPMCWPRKRRRCASLRASRPVAKRGEKARRCDKQNSRTTRCHLLPSQCNRCQALLPVDAVQVLERRQVLDVPAVAFNVVEHQALAVTCSCGQFHTRPFPAGVTDAVQWPPTCCVASVCMPTPFYASSATSMSPSTIRPSARCACPRSNRRYRAAAVRSTARNISASFVPRHAAQTRPLHARRATAPVRRRSYPVSCITAEQLPRGLVAVTHGVAQIRSDFASLKQSATALASLIYRVGRRKNSLSMMDMHRPMNSASAAGSFS